MRYTIPTHHKLVLFAGLLLSAGVFASAVRADQLVMKNGDRVTGSIIKQDGKEITIKTTNFGVVTAPWDQVASVQSDQPVTVVLKDGKTLEGTLAASGANVEIATKEAKVDVPPAEVVTIRNADEQAAFDRLLNPGLLELWTGTGTLGWAGTNGNAKTLLFTTAVRAARVTNNDKISLSFDLIKASALVAGKTSSTAQAVRGGIGYDRNVSPRLFVNLFNDYEYDKFQNLDLRVVIGGGLGYHVVKGPRAALDFVAGLDYNHSRFSTPLTTNAAEVYWGDEYNLKLSKATTFVQSFRMFNDLSHTGTYRVNADLGLTTALNGWLTWQLALSDRYLSDPAPGRKTNDWLYTTGLGITFGHK